MISIIIPHAGAVEPLKECIEGIKKNTFIPYEIIVVADKPSNETMEYLSKEENVRAIFNPEIMGVEPALNQGFKVGESECICLLTTDVEVTSRAIRAMSDALEAEPSFGWVSVSCEYTGFFTACSMMTRQAFEKVGLWDESYAAGCGFSDDDYLRRMWKAEYKPHIIDGVKVSHKHSESGTTRALYGKEKVAERFARNQAIFQKKYGETGTDWNNLLRYQPLPEIHRIEWVKSKVSLQDKILEVGVAENPVWKGTPFKVTTLDKSIRPEENCFPDVVGEAENLPFDNRSFDVVCENELLEHVADPQQVLKEATRVAGKKVICTVPAEHLWPGGLKPFWNPGHVRFYTRKSFEEELQRLGLPFNIELIRFGDWKHFGAEIYCDGGKVMVKGETKICLNLGSFVDIIKGPNWTNIDILPLREHIPSEVKFKQWDLRRGIPYLDNSVDVMRISHLIEHLTLDDAKFLLKEVHRTLKPGGLARIATPDARVIIRHFTSNDMGYFNAVEQPPEYITAETQCEKLSRLVFSGDYGHRALFDYDMLKNFLEKAGFATNRIFRSVPGFSHSEAMQQETLDQHQAISLYVEAVK